MGIDCSSKAIHSVWVDSHEAILTQYKWWSKEKILIQDFLILERIFGVILVK